MTKKSPEAFRTISEVAEWLGVPTHVLRFWESRFAQVKPVKRAGGRRYYRPADMELLGGIRKLLHDDGMTIRGVQKLLREEGVKHVAALSPGIDEPVMRDVTPDNVVSLEQVRAVDSTESAHPASVVEDAELVVEASADRPAAVPESETADAPEAAEPSTAEAAGATDTPETEASAAKEPAALVEPDDLTQSPEAVDFLAHDADIAPDPGDLEDLAVPDSNGGADIWDMPDSTAPDEPVPETGPAPTVEPEAGPEPEPAFDISHIPDDPPEDGGAGAVRPALAQTLRELRRTGADGGVDSDRLAALSGRLSALSRRMRTHA